MTIVLETRDFTRNGRTFRAEVVCDESSGPPWENMTTFGRVSEYRYGVSKAPGERVIVRDRGSRRVYDWAGAVRAARNQGLTGPDAVRAVQAEFDHLRGWCNDDWHYVGVLVFPLTDRGDELRSYSGSLWGIESDAGEYLGDVINELADQVEA